MLCAGTGCVSNKSFNNEHALEKTKIENIFFHNPKKPSEEKPKKKEINLLELRKALEDSFQNKPVQNPPLPDIGVAEKKNIEELPPDIPDKSVVSDSERELQDRIEQEKFEDKILEETYISESPPSEKKPIKPGETVKL